MYWLSSSDVSCQRLRIVGLTVALAIALCRVSHAQSLSRLDVIGLVADTAGASATGEGSADTAGTPSTDTVAGSAPWNDEGGVPVAPVAAQPNRVAEIGHAIVAQRAKTRRDDEAKIKPVLNALSGLREALRVYASQLTPQVELALPAGGPAGQMAPAVVSPDLQADDEPLSQDQSVAQDLATERREASRQAAGEALRVLSEQRQAVEVDLAQAPVGAPAQAQLATVESPAGDRETPAPHIHPEVIEKLEADTDAILSAPASTDDTTRADQIQTLLQRLTVSAPHAPLGKGRPTVVSRDSVPLPVQARGQ